MRCVQNVLREEVKEKMIWSVDRSSPSNKIRDLMKWSKDILKDIFYQRKILSSPIATFFTKQWSMLCPCYCLCQSCNAQVCASVLHGSENSNMLRDSRGIRIPAATAGTGVHFAVIPRKWDY